MNGSWNLWSSLSADGFFNQLSSSSSSPSSDFWGDGVITATNIRGGAGGCWATVTALALILLWRSARFFLSLLSITLRPTKSTKPVLLQPPSTTSLTSRISGIVTDADLKMLIDNLDDELIAKENWDNVIDKQNNLLAYRAKCCKPKEGPLKYLSETVFENCDIETLLDFYMDNDYRKKWDKMIVEHVQLQVDQNSGTEIGRTIKKFPLLTPREYVLAWRLWEGKDKTFYCFIKECSHSSAPLQKKYVRARYFRSGWRIRKVPVRNACEIKMVHQEDAGLNVEMAKVAFARGIWSYVCKMDTALRNYSAIRSPQPSSVVTAQTLMQKVPLEWYNQTPLSQETSSSSNAISETEADVKPTKLSRMPSKKSIGKGLFLLGGVVICLSKGHSTLGSRVTMAYILTKLSKRGAFSLCPKCPKAGT